MTCALRQEWGPIIDDSQRSKLYELNVLETVSVGLHIVGCSVKIC